MQYCVDPRSHNSLSILGFGCMRFPADYEASEKLVMDAIASGVNYFDTAYIYSKSESTLGRILSANKARDSVYIATKLPLMFVRNAQDFDKYFDRQLERLQTDRIDYYLMHMLGDRAQWEALCALGIEEWIAAKQKSGAIRQIGFSFHGPRDEFLSILDAYDWDFCQIQYNYADENYQAGVIGLNRAADKGILTIIMEPLLGGKLAGLLPQKAVDVFHKADPSISPAAWGLRWLWNQPNVHVVLSGMNTGEQLSDNVQTASAAAKGMLTEKEREAIQRVRQIFSETNKVPCTGCGYCLPCPKHVNIPGCFSSYNASFTIGRSTGLRQYMQSTGVLSEEEGRAGLCVCCGQCEARCPQHIEISSALQDVRKRFEPFWYIAGIRVARAILGKGKKKQS